MVKAAPGLESPQIKNGKPVLQSRVCSHVVELAGAQIQWALKAKILLQLPFGWIHTEML